MNSEIIQEFFFVCNKSSFLLLAEFLTDTYDDTFTKNPS